MASMYWSAERKCRKVFSNIVYPENLIELGYSWEQIRFYLLSRQYRRKLNMNMDAVKKESLRLDTLRSMIREITIPGENSEPIPGDGTVSSLIDDIEASFEAGMNNDLDTPSAVDGLFNSVQKLQVLHKDGRIGREQTRAVKEKLYRADSVLQFLF